MNTAQLILSTMAALIALTIHEFAHGYVAYRLGDGTAKSIGRLSLNPLKHLDPFGVICMVMFHFGWAKPVPINPMNFNDRKKGMALSAAAGPISNILLATASLALAKIILYTGYVWGFGTVNTTLYTVFATMCSINISLAIFNLLPFPPFAFLFNSAL